MKEKKYVLYLKILANYLLAGVIILFLVFVFPRLIVFFWPFIVGWIIAASLPILLFICWSIG